MAAYDDLLTTAKQLVQAITGAGQSFLSVHGISNLAAISAATVVKNGAGRVATVSITTAGSAPGKIYDATSTTDTSRPIVNLPNTLGPFIVDLPVRYGIVVAPGTAQIVTVGYS